ncbi:MAG TPA: UDP-glucose 4-epimerase GalE [bacterium]|nr:UDP-glucose 4-epimerase GalE [bacterium]HPM47697.1 UDP-glucose 4-epimerase GalE [bacterium]HRQ70790.1 UDP-glucose 4-epimerase GalE [bacterium]
MKILVTGGAGYIGSHVVKLLGERGSDEIVVLDNLSTGRTDAVLFGRLEVMDLSEFEKVDQFMKKEKFDAVIHFAAKIVVPESVANPLLYYRNNTVNTINLINSCVKYGVGMFIFSSTAAVYGEPEDGIVNENSLLSPISPYGTSKLMSEFVIKDTAFAHPEFKYVILRYFNVAGADPDGLIGQNFPDATHLIKVACQTALGMRESLSVFGTDFNTPDGTGVRDYIHVTDLASAHLAALDHLENGGNSDIYNCGYGKGTSVLEVIRSVRKVSDKDFPVQNSPRRAGDPAKLIADNSKILKELNWVPKFQDLNLICRTAYHWEKKTLKR